MINHFRTLLLNIPASEESIARHVASSFNGISLNADLQRIYNVLFPVPINNAKYFYAHNYLALLKSCGEDIQQFDSRISYDLENQEYFKVSRISSPIASHPQYQILVDGTLAANAQANYDYDNITVQNIGGDGTMFTVYSEVLNRYYGLTAPSTEQVVMTFAVSPTSPYISEPAPIPGTGLSLRFLLSTGFTSTTDKWWKFSVESPKTFNFFTVYNQLKGLNPFRILKRYNVDITAEQEIWTSHFNILYKFSAFLSAYVKVLNSLV